MDKVQIPSGSLIERNTVLKKTKYYYATVLYRSGKRPDVWRFTTERKRVSALKGFRKDPNVLDIRETEKWED